MHILSILFSKVKHKEVSKALLTCRFIRTNANRLESGIFVFTFSDKPNSDAILIKGIEQLAKKETVKERLGEFVNLIDNSEEFRLVYCLIKRYNRHSVMF